jgi:hypothetical protein
MATKGRPYRDRPFDRNYFDVSDVGGAPTRAPGFVPPDDLDVPLPVGRKLEHLGRAVGWFSDAVHHAAEERQELEAHIAGLSRATVRREAFRALISAVHKASKYEIYVGRAGASPRHLLARFQDHQANRGARWIHPVLRVSTQQLRAEDWEKHAIRWVRGQEQAGRLCCNNSVADSRGNWPDTEDCLIYLVACERPQWQ